MRAPRVTHQGSYGAVGPAGRRCQVPLYAFATAGLFLKKGRLSSSRLVDGTSSDAPERLDAHLFLGLGCTPCRWELSRLLNSIRGRQAAKAKRELAGTEVPLVQRGAGLKGWLRESMCQAAIRILRATAALAELLLPERRATSA